MNKLNIAVSVALICSMSVSFAQQTTTSTNSNGAIPPMPAAKPGQCHSLVYVPAKLGSTVENIVSQAAGETVEIIPAEYKWVEKKVPITDEAKSFEVIPATYKTIEEKVLVEPEKIDYDIIPAKFEEKAVKVEVRPAMSVWKRSSAGLASLSGEVIRLIEQPAQYKTITKKVMISGPKLKEVKTPAIYATIKKKVVDKPASVREIIVPAEFKTVRVKELVVKQKEIRKPTKPVMQEITKRTVLKKAEMNWKRIPCESDLNETNLKAIQKGLKAAGYDVSVDGKFGKGSIEALEQYQKKKGLAIGAITIETMKNLGVDIN